MTAFDVHHLGDRHTAGYPFSCRFGQVGNLGKISGISVEDQQYGIVAKGIAVVSIEVRWECTASFIAEEVVQRIEFSFVGSFFSAFFQLVSYKSGEQFSDSIRDT